MKTIRWGIIGVGNVTEVKSGPALQKAKNSRLVAVMRRTGSLAEDYARRHGVPRWYDDAQALIDDPDVDAVYIATPPDVHMQYTLAAARAGKPVYVEKPMALNYAQCRVMIEACRAAKVPLFVAYYRRALPRFMKVKELVEGGAIGNVRLSHVALHRHPRTDLDPDNLPWRYLPARAGGGEFVDLGSHILDFLDYLLGPIKEASGFAANRLGLYPAEDIVTGNWVFESGVQGMGSWVFNAEDEQDMVEIIGTEGKIVFSCFNEEPVTLHTRHEVQPFPITNPPHIQQPLIQTIVDQLNGVGQCPSSGESGARASWVMDEMLKSYYRQEA